MILLSNKVCMCNRDSCDYVEIGSESTISEVNGTNEPGVRLDPPENRLQSLLQDCGIRDSLRDDR